MAVTDNGIDSGKGGIVAGLGMTHTPGLGNLMDVPPAEQILRIRDGFAKVREEIEQARPDVVVAFVNDHLDMFTTQNMPSIAVAVGDTHWGPTKETEPWIQMKRGKVPGHAELGMAIYESLIRQDFDVHRIDSAEFVHNVLMPKKYVWPDRDIPVVPIFINCFAPPLPNWHRAYALGQAVREILKRSPLRVAVIASGGVAHWPPIIPGDLKPDDPLRPRLERLHSLGREVSKVDPDIWPDILEREQKMAINGLDWINEDWDREILRQLADADVTGLISRHHDVEREAGGSGGAEMLLWVALMGAMGDAKASLVLYEVVKEFIGSVAILSYPTNAHPAREVRGA